MQALGSPTVIALAEPLRCFVLLLTLPQTACMTLGKPLNLSPSVQQHNNPSILLFLLPLRASGRASSQGQKVTPSGCACKTAIFVILERPRLTGKP